MPNEENVQIVDKIKIANNIFKLASASNMDIIDNLTSEDNIKALSANQGRILNEKITSLIIYSTTDIEEDSELPTGSLYIVYDETE